MEIAEESNDPEWMLLRLPMKGGHREAAVVPVLRRPGGLMLAVSAKFFKDSELEEKAIPGVVEDLGPINRIQVEGVPDDLDAEGEEVDLVLVDWPQAFFKHLLGGGANPTWPLGAMFPSSASAVYKNLNYEQLAMVARTWVQNGQGPHTDGYQTAWEKPAATEAPAAPKQDILAQILAQTQNTAALVNRLQGELDELKVKGAPPAEEGGQASARPSALKLATQWSALPLAQRSRSRNSQQLWSAA